MKERFEEEPVSLYFSQIPEFLFICVCVCVCACLCFCLHVLPRSKILWLNFFSKKFKNFASGPQKIFTKPFFEKWHLKVGCHWLKMTWSALIQNPVTFLYLKNFEILHRASENFNKIFFEKWSSKVGCNQ